MISFRALFESTNLMTLSDDMKDYANQAYELTSEWLKLQKREGYSPEHILGNLSHDSVDIFKRRISHDVYENSNKIIFTISQKPEKDLIRFDGGFDVGKMNRVTIYFMSPKQIKNFSDKSIKQDFIDRVRHEICHALDPINNDRTIRKELDVDGQMQDQMKSKNYKQYISFPWEKKANLSTMAERNIENMISKGMEYSKILKEIDQWIPKISHSNYQKELDYFDDKDAWKSYKEFMKKLLLDKVRSNNV